MFHDRSNVPIGVFRWLRGLAAATDWRQIVALYDQLVQIQPSPVAQLNRAVAIAMRDGPEAGLAQIDAVLEDGELADYYLAHSARADMYRRLGRTAEARSSYEKALALTQQEPERQFLQERIRQLEKNFDGLSNFGAAVRLYGEGWIECADMDEAVAWARKGVAATGGHVGVREIFFVPAPEKD